MDNKIKECLNGNHASYMLPFLWLHGEPKERIYEEILAIKNSGINEFCAESRPYEKFCQEKWWDDFGFILKTARDLGMRVWLLDDQKFPTGYANGYLEKEENAHLRKRLIREMQIDVVGPMRGAKVYIDGRIDKNEKIVNIVAFKKDLAGETLDHKSAIDLTDKYNDGMVYFDIPKGTWRVSVTIETTYQDKSERLFYYIDMLNYESCHAMIDAIYQPHYEHFSEYFGNTFAGFFSDEPGFLNVAYTYYNNLGQMGSPYPWRDDLPKLIGESAGITEDEVWLLLPGLWEDIGEKTQLIRTHYMEVVTRLYSENFGYMLGNWCREHGVMYIGHIIEDMGAHMRLGYGSGHFFRALDGQDMAGIDIVLMQDIPGIDGVHRAPLADGGAANPDFFRYTLPKLASSHSHIQPLKQGRAMCEIFGAFGWAEGLPFMKGLADNMIASGVNRFVPHAFSPLSEDTDCPPHFYNGGKNVQYPLFKNLMEYMQRCIHTLDGGKHIADVAVFYNAEGEWANQNGKLFFEICQTLTKNQIDFDIIPYDALKDAEVKDGKLYVNKESYGALIVSESEIMMRSRMECFDKLAKNGLDVIFINSLPAFTENGEDISELTKGACVVKDESLVEQLKKCNHFHIAAEGIGTDNLRFYHVKRDGKDIYLFSNEGIYSDLDATLSLNQSGECLIYEPWENKLYKSEAKDGKLNLHLEKGNMIFVIFGDEIPSDTPYFTKEISKVNVDMRFDILTMEEGETEYKEIAKDSYLFDISAPDKNPHFSGKIMYKSTFKSLDGHNVIDLGQVGEVAEAWLNGKYLGARINAPYKFDMTSALKQGENELTVVVTSNLAHRRRDWFSTYMQIPPSGIIGEISLCKYEK